MKLPKLAIITPTHNRQSYLCTLYNSIKRHAFITQWLIVDDGSVDQTKDKVSTIRCNAPTHLKINYYYQSNKGMKAAINAAIPYLAADYFCKIDSDDYLTNQFGEYYKNMFTSLRNNRELDRYHHFSMGCKDENGIPINRISKKAKKHGSIINGYVITYSKDRLYEQTLSGDLLDIFPAEAAKKWFRYPYLPGYGHCPSGIMHMFFVLYYRNRSQFFYNYSGLYKHYLNDGISKTKKNRLPSSPQYYLISAIMELSLPKHSPRSALRSLKTFTRAAIIFCLRTTISKICT